MKIKMEDVHRIAMEWWGLKPQLNQMIEECSELIHAICKLKRTRDLLDEEGIDRMCEEIADVEIMISQFKWLYPKQIEKWKIIKLARLIGRLEDEQNKSS
jgi:ASC-1-like (ASCH) protein